MKNSLIAIGMLLFGAAVPAHSEIYVDISSIELAMSGNSSSGTRQTWMRVIGQPSGVPTTCVYDGKSLFYTDSSSGISPDQALALLLTAKSLNRTISIGFNEATSASDFFGYGISKCQLSKIAMK